MDKFVKSIKYALKNYTVETIILIVVAIILINTLFISPIVGRYDNGDFGRLIMYGGLDYPDTKYELVYNGHLHLNYVESNLGILLPFGPNWVSGSIIVKISVLINNIVNNFRGNIFDIRYQTFIYSALFMLSIFLISSYKRFSKLLKVVAGLFFIIFFTDINYIAYFNSFYGEAATYTFFFLNIGSFLYLINKEKPKLWQFTFFFVSSAGFLTSKTQHLPLLLFMLIVYVGLYIFYKDKLYRKHIMICSTLIIILCACTYISISDYTNKNNIYQAVFTGILKGSKTPEKDLAELGLNKKFASLANTGFYDKNLAYAPVGKVMLTEFYPNISEGKVLMFYIDHPARAWEKFKHSAATAYLFGGLQQSNFIEGQYNPNKTVNILRYKLTQKFKWIEHNLYFYVIFSAIFLAVITYYFFSHKDRETKLLMLMLLFILAAEASQLVLPVIGSGEADFMKHLFLINVAMDTMIGISLLWIVNMISKGFNFVKNRLKREEETPAVN